MISIEFTVLLNYEHYGIFINSGFPYHNDDGIVYGDKNSYEFLGL